MGHPEVSEEAVLPLIGQELGGCPDKLSCFGTVGVTAGMEGEGTADDEAPIETFCWWKRAASPLV